MGLDGVREETESVQQNRSTVSAGGAGVVDGGLERLVGRVAAGHAPVRAVDGGGSDEEEQEEEEEEGVVVGGKECGHLVKEMEKKQRVWNGMGFCRKHKFTSSFYFFFPLFLFFVFFISV